MKSKAGERIEGPAGAATEIIITDPDEGSATIAVWLLHCPGQTPAYSHFQLSTVHLREEPGLPPVNKQWPGATHELMLWGLLDEHETPRPDDVTKWRMIRPFNMVEQVELPDDKAASELTRLCAKAVAEGLLPAEPPLSGQVEPWRTVLLQTSAHMRGEPHANGLDLTDPNQPNDQERPQ